MTPEENGVPDHASVWPPTPTQAPPQRVLRPIEPGEVKAGRVSFGMFFFVVIMIPILWRIDPSTRHAPLNRFVIIGGFLVSLASGLLGIQTRLGKAGLVMTLLTAATIAAIIKWG